MGLHYGVQVRTVDASGQPWRDPLDGQPFLGSLDSVSTCRPTTSQNRTAVSSWQVARDTDGQENQMAAGLEQIRPANRDSQYSPARTEG